MTTLPAHKQKNVRGSDGEVAEQESGGQAGKSSAKVRVLYDFPLFSPLKVGVLNPSPKPSEGEIYSAYKGNRYFIP